MVITCEKCLAKLEALGVPVVPASNDYGHRCHQLYDECWNGGFVLARGAKVVLSRGVLHQSAHASKRRRWSASDGLYVGPQDSYLGDAELRSDEPKHCHVRKRGNTPTVGFVLCNTSFPLELLTLADGLDPIDLTTSHIEQDREKIEAWLAERAAEQKAAAEKAANDQAETARVEAAVAALSQAGIEAKPRYRMFSEGAPDGIIISADDAARIARLLSAVADLGGGACQNHADDGGES